MKAPKRGPSSFLLFSGLLFCALLTLHLQAEKKPTPPAPKDTREEPFTFKVPVDVVVVNATVTDRKGNPVKDLTAEDFKVYEDGKPQRIHTFSLESYKTEKENLSAKESGSASTTTSATKTSATNPRYISLFIDDLTQPAIELYRPIILALREFVSLELKPGDLVSIMAASGQAGYPFTSSQAELWRNLEEIQYKLNISSAFLPTCPHLSDLQANRIVTLMGRLAMAAPENSEDDAIRVAVEEMLACDAGVRAEIRN